VYGTLSQRVIFDVSSFVTKYTVNRKTHTPVMFSLSLPLQMLAHHYYWLLCLICVHVVQIVATRSCNVDMVSLLVGVAGSDVNKASYIARSRAIHWAASSSDCDGSVECLRVLLDAGADAESRVASGRTPLMLAARAGHLQAVDQLLRHGWYSTANTRPLSHSNDQSINQPIVYLLTGYTSSINMHIQVTSKLDSKDKQ